MKLKNCEEKQIEYVCNICRNITVWELPRVLASVQPFPNRLHSPPCFGSAAVHAQAVRQLLECWFSHHDLIQPLAALLAATGVPVPSLNAIAI